MKRRRARFLETDRHGPPSREDGDSSPPLPRAADRAGKATPEVSLLKADLFVHLKVGDLARRDDVEAFVRRLEPQLEGIAACGNVERVNFYISDPVEEMIRSVNGQASSFHIPGERLQKEQRAIDTVKSAYDRVVDRQQRRSDGAPSRDPPRLECIASREMMPFFCKLLASDRSLVQNLAGPSGQFTYDDPKFIDHALRIARRDHQRPLLRLDADVIPNPSAISGIAECYVEQVARSPFFAFSGGYRGNGHNDHLNGYAVRTHFLPREAIKRFLRDLGEVGAPQRRGPCSRAAQELIQRRNGRSVSQTVPQPISGAGFVLSAACARRLPPFLNIGNLIVWCDDYHKRLLHQGIGDIPKAALQRVDVTFQQDRHPNGVRQQDYEWAASCYFDRLLRGCLQTACIMNPLGQPGPLGEMVARIADDLRPSRMSKRQETRLRRDVQRAAQERFEETMTLWAKGGYGMISEWAMERSTQDYQTKICESMAADAVAYANLVADWPAYVRALDQLEPFDAHWLFA